MDFNKKKRDDKALLIGKDAGFVTGLTVFATILAYVLSRHSIGYAVVKYGAIFWIAVVFVAIFRRIPAKMPLGSPKRIAEGFPQGMKRFANLVSDAVNWVLLTIVYYIGVGFVAVISSALGKKFLDLGYKDRKSYYVSIERGNGSQEDYLRQF
jgi:hypothetical protein